MKINVFLMGIFFTGLIQSFAIQAETFTVDIFKKQYIPAKITIKQGDTVIWNNIEKRQYHNVWFKGLIKEEPDYLFPDESYQMTFNNTGDFAYECGPHPKMKGLVSVVKNTAVKSIMSP
jgi:plastocyanin